MQVKIFLKQPIIFLYYKTNILKFYNENSYKNNVSDLINDVIIDYNEKFKHLNFSNNEISKLNLDKIFVINDEASHINPQPHKDIFLKKIIGELSKEINPL